MRARRGTLSRQAMLSSAPRLNPAVHWEDLDTGELMAVYRRYTSPWGVWLTKLLCRPELSQLILDKIGARVVRAIDGEKNVSDLIAFVSREFKMSRKESEISLLKYLELLARRNLIGFDVGSTRKDR